MTGGEEFPAELTAVYGIGFDYADGDGVDFEPFDRFEPADETTDWFRAWTGNSAVSGDWFRVIGRDGSGGSAAFWLIRDGRSLVEQPVVFLGSEGEAGVVAANLADYLWLLADGFGPLEAVMYPDRAAWPQGGFAGVAERYAAAERKSGAEVMASARRQFGDFERVMDALCR